ncbi:ATP:ADP antiporter, AAA family [Hyphomicrobium facile]|uniref:ATP:ADP antiporter, AAA family n=1 Tax=Hyphomicrobium facile TaxID=51670 RepID=A0A1I7NPT8_9HYPH|nr:ATP:ADP antiporter, AAA family [Hyphomicrobium facile]
MRRFVDVAPGEISALLASFAMFFALLSAYYIIRPVRDEMGVSLGKDSLRELFTVVFVVMLVLVPLFGFVATRFPRRYVLPSIYSFFSVNLVIFWLVLKASPGDQWVAGSFFVWASVFNLFVVSLFWSLMSELWSHEEATRLYGFISAGGTAGALAGPLFTQGLVRVLPPVDLLAVSAALLIASMLASLQLRRLRPAEAKTASEPAGGGILDGAIKVFTTPMFARIALFIFITNIIGTFFYLEQARLVAASIDNSADRVLFFSGRDLAVSVVTFLIEVFGTARVLRRFGVTGALLALPLTGALGVLLLTFDAALWIVAAVMVAERIVSFALANPAIKVIYTLATPADKYKVQNFIDTVVFRGGDATSGWLFSIVGGGLGFAAGATGAIAIPLVVAWLWTAERLGANHKQRAAELSVSD